MPHCIIEHSADLDGELLVDTVFSGALASNLFEADGSDIKVRAQGYNSYCTGGKKSGFIHVTLKILSGRTAAQKADLSETVLSRLALLDTAGKSVSVEVVDIDRTCYRKLLG